MKILKLARNQWDRTAAIAFVLGGLVCVIVGWTAVRHTIFTFEQIPYVMSGGLIGVCLVALGATLWLSADLRDEWRKLDRLEGVVREGIAAGADVREIALPPEAGESEAPSSTRRLRVSAEP
jgi:uncharacterized membrane protein YfcA